MIVKLQTPPEDPLRRLLLGQKRKMLTNVPPCAKICQKNQAEVAVFISTVPDRQIAGPRKGKPPKDAVSCHGLHPGSAQNMRRTVIQQDGVLTGGIADSMPCVAPTQGFFNVRYYYEKDTLSDQRKG